MKLKTALISVSDKSGILELGRFLNEIGVEILSSGGTARFLISQGIKVTEVSQYTGFPEILDGRVKTLHPLVHGGILAKRDEAHHLEEVKRFNIKLIDLVVVNLYPFKEIVSKGASPKEAIEQIDIGGPTLVRAAAKNFHYVTVLIDPEDYPKVIKEIRERGEVSLRTRFELAKKAFWHVYDYDKAIAQYLESVEVEP
jgi:phosphoribosylaminoimidazolecarboxamide formyltransferase/IMP cyclohydrolase